MLNNHKMGKGKFFYLITLFDHHSRVYVNLPARNKSFEREQFDEIAPFLDSFDYRDDFEILHIHVFTRCGLLGEIHQFVTFIYDGVEITEIDPALVENVFKDVFLNLKTQCGTESFFCTFKSALAISRNTVNE